MGFTLTTPPAVEPVSINEAMVHVKLDVSNAESITEEVVVTVTAPGALTGDTVVPVTPLEVALSVGDLLKFGDAQVVVLAEVAAVDDEEITVNELPFDLEAGTDATIAGDVEISAAISAARRQAERYTSAGIVSQVWTQTLAGFGVSPIQLARGPVRSIDSIVYVDADGAEQTIVNDAEADPPTTALSDLVVLDQTPLSATVSIKSGQVWPATGTQMGAVRIVYTVGYGTNSTDVDTDLKAAILLRVGDLYRNKEAQTSSQLIENRTVCALLDPHVRTALS